VAGKKLILGDKTMLVFNIPKQYENLIAEITDTFENSELLEVDSLGADTLIQVIVPLIETSISALALIIIKAQSISSKVEVEWDGIKIKGTEKQVEKFLNKICSLNEKKTKGKNRHDSKGIPI
jgi:hypothetical protein